jgi:hypothetical protein
MSQDKPEFRYGEVGADVFDGLATGAAGELVELALPPNRRTHGVLWGRRGGDLDSGELGGQAGVIMRVSGWFAGGGGRCRPGRRR